MKRHGSHTGGRSHPGDWESLIDRIVREARDKGAFDDLPGAGKPLRMDQNPHTPREWQLAFHILQNAGYRPAWIEQRLSIEAALDSVRASCRQSFENADSEQEEHAILERFRLELEAINKQIDSLNLGVPLPAFQRPRIRIESELDWLGRES